MGKVPTLEEAMYIVESNPVFYYKDEKVDGKTFRIFNYRLADYRDFKELDAFELRGLVYDLDTEESYLSIHKFFNLNENEDYMLHKVEKMSDYFRIIDKIDGSLITPFIIDNRLYVKSKTSFKSEQAKLALKFLKENKNYIEFIKACCYDGLQPIFELVSPYNQIVVYYPETKLVCIQLRRKGSGLYMPIDYMDSITHYYKVESVKWEWASLKELLNRQKHTEGVEGWVVTNDNGFFMKVKTDWYIERHRLVSPENLHEHIILEYILNETIDDVISYLNDKSEVRKKLISIREKFDNYFGRTINKIEEILSNDGKKLERKDFAMKYKNHPYFGILMKFYGKECTDEEISKFLKQYLLKTYNKKEKAKNFLKQIGVL